MVIKIPKKIEATFLDIGMYLDRWGTNNILHCNIDFESNIKEDILAKALRLSLDAEPILGCKFVTDDKTAFFERRDDLNNLKLLTISSSEVFSNNELMEYIIIDIDPTEDPFVQAKIFRTKESDFLCIKISHIPMDIGGFKEYIALLSTLYNNLIKNINYKPIPNVDGDRSMTQIFGLFGKKQLRSISRKTYGILHWKLLLALLNPSYQNKLGFPYSGRINTKINYTVRKLNLKGLNEYRKKKNYTVNDILLTGILRTIFRLLKPDQDVPIVIDVSMDLRKHLPDKKAGALANIVGQSTIKINIDDKKTFEEILNSTKEKMDKKKKEYQGIGSIASLEKINSLSLLKVKKLMKKFAKKTFESGKFVPKLSNFGILCPESFGGPGFKLFKFPSSRNEQNFKMVIKVGIRVN